MTGLTNIFEGVCTNCG